MDANLDKSAFTAPPDDTEFERASEELRENGDDIKPHLLLIQVPQVVRKLHFDSLLIQLNSFYVRLRKWDQCFFVVAIDFQYFTPARLEHIDHRTHILTVGRYHATTFQLKRIKPALFGRGNVSGSILISQPM